MRNWLVIYFFNELKEISPFFYCTTSVPKPHSIFDNYTLKITPNHGLSWIKAIGKTVQTSAYGGELRSVFDLMLNKLANSYGKHESTDLLRHGSIWDEPRDWMQSLIAKERIMYALWNKEQCSNLRDSLVSLFLGVNALSTSEGFILLEYSFENEKMATDEIDALEDDAL